MPPSPSKPDPYGDSDSESDVNDTSPLALSASEKRLARKARFDTWLRDSAIKEINTARKKLDKYAVDDELSIRQLLASQESTQIITDPREYQLELFERAKNQNTIAVLDTGSGKTLIAVLLLRHVIDTELQDRMLGKSPRISFFLVPSVTLVFQQFAVLERNLDHSVDRFCGAMNCNLWTKEHWDDHFAKNHVLVCTADVLKHCLNHSFITMPQINLLIFDEAHHAKKGHAYAQIIKDFYVPNPDQEPRPRIFGMTASPVDARVDVRQAASDLENMLHSQIATASDMSLLQKAVTKPDEMVLSYSSPPSHLPPTDLFQTLKSQFGNIKIFKSLFDHAAKIRSHLGLWCSDRYWTYALDQKRSKKLESRVEKSMSQSSTVQIDQEIEQIRSAMEIVSNHDFGTPTPQQPYLSHKIVQLHRFLSEHFEHSGRYRCIVFVEQRSTAYLLEQVFNHLGGAHLHAGILIGSGTGRLDDVQATFRSQVVTLMKFRKGELNCLFATSVAEEGLDIPDCNLVVRFDICKTMIQYVQSRGRARHKNSKFLHMKEANNWDHDTLMDENRGAETVMRFFCEALPDDRKLTGYDDVALTDEMIRRLQSYTVKETGAKITFGSALQILSHFVASLPQDGDDTLQATYVTTNQAGKFLCEVILPGRSPIRSVIGDVKPRKSIAKRSAAFKACVELRQKGYLNAQLVPIYFKQLPQMRNAALALSSKKSDMYDQRLKPKFWEHDRGTIPRAVYMTHLDVPQGLKRAHRPLLLITRQPLPSLPKFPLYPSKGQPRFVETRPFHTSWAVKQDELVKLTTFTLRIFKDIFNKTYEQDTGMMPYWIAPAKASTKLEDIGDCPWDMLDWATADHVCENEGFQWTPDMPDSSLVDKFLIDRWNGGRRFFSVRMAPEYKPTDPVPQGCASAKWQDHILDYTVSLWQKARKTKTWNLDQPVIEAEKVLHRRNLLAEPTSKETQDENKTRSFLCPEPLRISALPTEIVTTCYVFPAIIHRIDEYLIAKETAEALDLDIDIALALEALTKDSGNTEDHQNHERINFQRGMGKNYERLEFLGDCFLKMATSISVFTQNPNDNEFDFHVKRMLLLCNKNLFTVAQKLKLYENIRSRSFSRRTWYPEGLKLLEGKGANKSGNEIIKHSLGDKTVADVCEALMGAAFLTHDQPGAWKPEHWRNAVMAVTKLVGHEDHEMMDWSDYSRAYKLPAYQTGDARASTLELAKKVQKKHSYKFRYPRLLQAAFHHPSYPNMWSDKIPSYQRLEFLGDSLLDLASITHLFYKYPDKDPQWLTEHKMAMVSNQFLGALCVKIGLWQHLVYNHDALRQQISEYVDEIKSAEAASQGKADYWTTVKDPPKCLPDIVEAYVGAVFIDADFDYCQVQRFFDEHMKPFFEDMSIYDTYANNHPITRLHSVLEKEFGCHDFQLMSDGEEPGDMGPSIYWAGLMIHDASEPIGIWHAKSVRYASVKSATLALEELEGLAPYEFRAKYGCDCRETTEGLQGQ